jgi:hypothetical protein
MSKRRNGGIVPSEMVGHKDVAEAFSAPERADEFLRKAAGAARRATEDHD